MIDLDLVAVLVGAVQLIAVAFRDLELLERVAGVDELSQHRRLRHPARFRGVGTGRSGDGGGADQQGGHGDDEMAGFHGCSPSVSFHAELAWNAFCANTHESKLNAPGREYRCTPDALPLSLVIVSLGAPQGVRLRLT
ncbi:hypothetical protein ebA6245 [Aromatoleum aromaticum EbN1]|uniref:Uncharacterized protein n=1 Tax=Aromatoleum aromaticum (strain DSM 19018 / LMG 30748 / EbN1) TaxID=76114 RepID=Q5NZ19_AROAE|nr:hypothetical protein ebA6245 [Aromatoleum aromaticum EbN1]